MTQSLPILVVEDDPNLREAVCDTLELAGHAVLSAEGGDAARGTLVVVEGRLVQQGPLGEPWTGISEWFVREADGTPSTCTVPKREVRVFSMCS